MNANAIDLKSHIGTIEVSTRDIDDIFETVFFDPTGAARQAGLTLSDNNVASFTVREAIESHRAMVDKIVDHFFFFFKG